MAGRYGDLDYPSLTKRGMAFGFLLFVFGALGDTVVASTYGPLPEWEYALFLDMEVLGVIVLLLTPFVFGIALPLTE